MKDHSQYLHLNRLPLLLLLVGVFHAGCAQAQDLMGFYWTKDRKHMVSLNGTPGTSPRNAILAATVETDENTQVLLSGPAGCLVHSGEPGVFTFSGTSKETSVDDGSTIKFANEKGRLTISRRTDGTIQITTTDITHFDGKVFILDQD